MKSIFIFMSLILFSTAQAHAFTQIIECTGKVFYSQSGDFQVVLTDGIGSNIEYESETSSHYFSIRYSTSPDGKAYSISSEVNEAGALYLKIDLSAKNGQMISIYNNKFDSQDDKPAQTLGTCRLLK